MIRLKKGKATLLDNISRKAVVGGGIVRGGRIGTKEQASRKKMIHPECEHVTCQPSASWRLLRGGPALSPSKT